MQNKHILLSSSILPGWGTGTRIILKRHLEMLEKKGFNIILWGRSMGAATALRYGKAKIIVADSSFQSFRSLCKQVA